VVGEKKNKVQKNEKKDQRHAGYLFLTFLYCLKNFDEMIVIVKTIKKYYNYPQIKFLINFDHV